MVSPAYDGGLNIMLPEPATWMLILHTIFANGAATTIHLGPYTEAGCNQAAEHYEAALRVTIHYGRDGGDPTMVTKGIAVCLPAGRKLP